MRKIINRKCLSFLTAFSVLLILFSVNISPAFAEGTKTEKQHIFDEAELLSGTEKQTLEEKSIQYGEDAGIDMVVLTHNDSHAEDPETYIENFYDENDDIYTDGVFLLIDMYNREVFIEGYGTAETYIHSKRINTIIDEITPDLKSENYVGAIETFFQDSNAYMKDDSEVNNDHNYNSSYTDYETGENTGNAADSILQSIWFQILISLIIGGITVGIMAYNAGGKMTAGGNTYIDAGNSGLIGRRDDYIRTTVTRVRKPKENNTNSGGFTGGISSGGHSHSSGGGKF